MNNFDHIERHETRLLFKRLACEARPGLTTQQLSHIATAARQAAEWAESLEAGIQEVRRLVRLIDQPA